MRLSFKNYILSAVLIAIIALLALAFVLQYRLSLAIVDDELRHDVNALTRELNSELQHLHELVNLSFLGMKVLRESSYTAKQLQVFAVQYRNVMQRYNGIARIGFAADDNRYIYLRQQNESFTLIVRHGVGKAAKTSQFYLDNNGSLHITKEMNASVVMPAQQWFKQAKRSSDLVMSLPHAIEDVLPLHEDALLSRRKEMFITYASAVNQGVLFLDIGAERFETLLGRFAAQRHSEIFFVANEKVWLRSHEHTYDDSWLLAHRDHLNNDFQSVEITLSKSPFSVFLLFNTANARMAYRPFYYQFLAAIVLLVLLALLFSQLLAQKVVRPIQHIMEQNRRISARAFDEVKSVESNIVEMNELSHSLQQMAQSIAKHQAEQSALLDAFIQVIADAIDAKSPYTAGHCQRVPELALMIAQQMHDDKSHPFYFQDEDERRCFELAAWLHDCGKVTTPEFVVDKATKLETVHNRIHEIRTRFEVLYRDVEITYLQACLHEGDSAALRDEKEQTQRQLMAEFETVAHCNMGGEFLDAKQREALHHIATKRFASHFSNAIGLSQAELLRMSEAEKNRKWVHLLEDLSWHKIAADRPKHDETFSMKAPALLYNRGELYNLCVERGTLSAEERYKINEHVMMSYTMLQSLPLPAIFSQLPLLAASHHETLDGTGYPRGVDETALTLPMRILAIADIFEALSASDRPYKPAKSLSEIMQILLFMAKDRHIDAAVLHYMVDHDIALAYANRFMQPQMIDAIDKTALLERLAQLMDAARKS